MSYPGFRILVMAVAGLAVLCAVCSELPPRYAGAEVLDYRETMPSRHPAKAGAARAFALTATAAESMDADATVREWLVKSTPESPIIHVKSVEKKSASLTSVSTCDYVANQVIVTLMAGEDLDAFRESLAEKGFVIKRQIYQDSEGNRILLVAAGDPDLNTVESLMTGVQDTGVRAEVEYDIIFEASAIPNDTEWPQLWGMEKIGAPQAWATRTDASAVTVAVLDTGVNYNHVDLNANMWVNPGEVAGNNQDDDDNGIYDDVYGMRCVGGVITGNPMDDVKHGSHCAGTIGAVGNNSQGVVGVAWHVKIMALKFLDSNGLGSLSDALTCLQYAAEHGVKLVSCSFGTTQYSSPFVRMVKDLSKKGVVFVCAAGNNGWDNDSYPNYPSSIECSNVVAVAASDSSDRLASFSCYGAESVDIAAPGVGIYSTTCASSISYESLDGTSMATPHVTGALALLMAHYPDESPYQIVERLYAAGEELQSLAGKVRTGRRLSLSNAFGLPCPSAATVSQGMFTDRVSVYWNAVNGASHYRVSRSEVEDGGKVVLSDWFSGLTFIDATAVPGVVYWYFIQASSSADGKSASPYSAGASGFCALPSEAQVQVNFLPQGGVVSVATKSYIIGREYGSLPVPVNGGKTFVGWHTAAAGGARVDEASVACASQTSLYAHWIDNGTPYVCDFAARQRYPWNGLVDIEFSLVGLPRGELADVALTAVDIDTAEAFAMRSFIPGGATSSLTNGMHAFVWNADADNPGQLHANLAVNMEIAVCVPSVPTQVSAADGVSTSAVAVAWQPAPGASSYEIYRSETQNSADAVQIGVSDTCAYSDMTAAPGVPYYYWIKSVSSGGTSEFGTPEKGGRRVSPPSLVSAGDDESAQHVAVWWSSSAGASAYQVWRGDGPDLASASNIATVVTTNFVDTTAWPGNSYCYWIRAVAANGVSDFSAFDVGSCAVLSPPTNVGVSDAGFLSYFGWELDDTYSSCLVVWFMGVPTDAKYEIWCSFRDDVGKAEKLGTITSDMKQMVYEKGGMGDNLRFIHCERYSPDAGSNVLYLGILNGAEPGRLYWFWVKAVNEHGAVSDFSDGNSGYVSLLAPSVVRATDGESATNVTVSWSAVTNANTYQIWRGTTSNSSSAQMVGVSGSASYTDETVQAGKAYYYWVKAVCDFSVSDFGPCDVGYAASDDGDPLRYMVVSLDGSQNEGDYAVSYLAEEPAGGWTYEHKTSKLVLRKIDPGSFAMGVRETDCPGSGEDKLRSVALTKPYYVGVFEVTQRQWEMVMGDRPSYFTNSAVYASRPVEHVSYDAIRGTNAAALWPDAMHVDEGSFLHSIRKKTGIAGFNIPTCAQWEYACRAGTDTALNTGNNLTDGQSCPNMAVAGRYNTDGDRNCGTDQGTAVVGMFLPNAWGLYDMHGNAAEWCLDAGEPVAGGWATNLVLDGMAALRGGGYDAMARNCRSGAISGAAPNDGAGGLRLVINSAEAVAQALNNGLDWIEDADHPWAIDRVNSFDGDVSLRSGLVLGGQSSRISTVVTGPGVLTFRWKTSCENSYATLRLMDNDIVVKNLSGRNPGWELVTYNVSAGEHELVWEYCKQRPGAEGDDSAWVDTVAFTRNPSYAVIDVSGGPSANSYPVAYLDGIPNGGWTDEYKTDKIVLRRIPAGSFTMGSPKSEEGRDGYGVEDLHDVVFTDDFYIGVFEITQRQWELVMGSRPSFFDNPGHYATRPVEQVSYDMIRGAQEGTNWPNSASVDVSSFIGRLRSRSGLSALDLPTEAMWEYACRAGTGTALNLGVNISGIIYDSNGIIYPLTPDHAVVLHAGRFEGVVSNLANADHNCGTNIGTAAVGSSLPNNWGLYDMHGNVEEWCLDWCGDYAYQTNLNPLGPESCAYEYMCNVNGTMYSRRIVRGGVWGYTVEVCRSAKRMAAIPSDATFAVGLRLATVPESFHQSTGGGE